MTMPSACWRDDDLAGYTEVNPPTAMLQFRWSSAVLDLSGVPSPKIIRVGDPFDVRFRIEFLGLAWQCMGGDLVFDIRFEELGGPNDFKLSSRLPADALTVKNWKGCDQLCVEHQYRVPANTIEDGVYELTSTFRLYCCGKPGPFVGFQPKGQYQWYG
ncbi:hypothetical protein ABGB12_08645 [Actinocorallia sp. B10E7]|uniref:hypothetical protein n=1 Tax=Actinocorallia sp. B10E7 TaxID=3153558 RepID=UPI00325DB8EC